MNREGLVRLGDGDVSVDDVVDVVGAPFFEGAVARPMLDAAGEVAEGGHGSGFGILRWQVEWVWREQDKLFSFHGGSCGYEPQTSDNVESDKDGLAGQSSMK